MALCVPRGIPPQALTFHSSGASRIPPHRSLDVGVILSGREADFFCRNSRRTGPALAAPAALGPWDIPLLYSLFFCERARSLKYRIPPTWILRNISRQDIQLTDLSLAPSRAILQELWIAHSLAG